MIPNKCFSKVLIVGTFTLVVLFELGSACKCLLPSLQDRYCRSDFVLKVRVRSNLLNPNGQQDFDDYYKIRIKQQWKFNFANMVDRKSRVYTGSNSAMCGVYLEIGKTYLISGTVDQTARRMEINSCSSIVEMAPLSPEAGGLQSNPPVCA